MANKRQRARRRTFSGAQPTSRSGCNDCNRSLRPFAPQLAEAGLACESSSVPPNVHRPAAAAAAAAADDSSARKSYIRAPSSTRKIPPWLAPSGPAVQGELVLAIHIAIESLPRARASKRESVSAGLCCAGHKLRATPSVVWRAVAVVGLFATGLACETAALRLAVRTSAWRDAVFLAACLPVSLSIACLVRRLLFLPTPNYREPRRFVGLGTASGSHRRRR